MLTGKAVKDYLRSIIVDIDSGKAPTRPQAPKWVRQVAVPAAVGLTLGMGGLAGCVGESVEGPDITRDMASDAKADGMDL